MSANDSLPVILVSAVDAATASELISEIIDDGSSPAQCNGVAGHGDDPHVHPRGDAGAVWELRNKYYTARAHLLPLADGAAPPPGRDVQAHIIYLTENECSDASACSRRCAAAGVGRGCVRLVAARGAREDPAAAWARTQRYELVALHAPAPPPPPPPTPQEDDDEEDIVAEARGVARVREALHAHVWPGLRLARAPPHHPPSDDDHDVSRVTRRSSADSASSGSESSWGSWVGGGGGGGGGGGERGAVERAEQFADALALLPARRALAGDGGDGDAARRLRAEQLVAAFCRALGHELRLDAGEGGGGQ